MSDTFDPSHPTALTAVQGARLLAALEAAQAAAARAISEQRAASGGLRRQQLELEAVLEAGQKLSGRGRDIRNSLQELRQSVDRAKLTALNAGLEGARLGDPVGKALVIMGDEVRNLLARAMDALEEHGALLAEVDRDRDRCLADLVKLSDDTRQTASAVARAEQQSQLNNALLAELKVDLSELCGTDPETARMLGEATAQLKTATDALRELSQRAALRPSAVRELLRPLLSLIPPEEDDVR
ncbi:MAG: methyl-accepting chemotaxis protein [Myxococcales bacterium]|jgi:methyl-accepting chemotaxis protein